MSEMIPHPSEFIAEELMARGWSADDLARRMSDGTARDFSICRASLDLYDIVGPDETRMRIGGRSATLLAKAFGTSAQFFINLENAWLRSKGVDPEDTHEIKQGES